MNSNGLSFSLLQNKTENLIKLTLCNSSAGGGEQEYKIVDDYNAVGSDEKPNLIFGKSESVMDDEGKKTTLLIFLERALELNTHQLELIL